MDNTRIEDRVASIAGEAVAAVGAIANDAMTQVEGLASEAAAAAGQTYGRTRDRAREAAATVATSVEQQPLITLLAVGFICATVGFLLGRR